MGKLRKFFSLTSRQRGLFMEAVFFLFRAKILLTILPVRTLLLRSPGRGQATGKADPEVLGDIRQALHRANRIALWKNRCLVQSIAGRWMLRRRRIASQITFGVNHDREKRLVAHAWLKAGGFEVVDRNGEYHELKII